MEGEAIVLHLSSTEPRPGTQLVGSGECSRGQGHLHGNPALLAGFDPSGRLQEALQRAIPMRRLANPADFPGIVAFFLGDEAGYVTGQVVSVSGAPATVVGAFEQE